MEDKVLKRHVEDELEWEPSVNAAGIGVCVENGIVQLTGHVSSYAQMFAAEKAVKRIKGVRGYVTDVEVRLAPEIHSDESIAGRIANILEWDVTVPNAGITVKVHEGRVTLTGQVEWAFQRSAAEAGLRQLTGVRSVNNLITLAPRAKAIDIQRRIVDALERRADAAASHVTVSVVGDKVTLEGALPTWAERDAIEHAVWAAPGVAAVEDLTTISA